MELSTLKAFITVAQKRSFSAAASLLHLTQPAVSKRVAALEQDLGTRLFDRIGRTITLTDAGDALLPRALQILREVRESRRMIANLSGKVGGRLSLGTSHHIGLHRLPPVLRAYTTQFPQVDLDLHFLDSEAGCEAVEQGTLDIAVVTLPPIASPKLLLTNIWEDPLEVVVVKDHPLAGYREITVQDLAEHGAILPAVGTFTRTIVISPFEEQKLQLKHVLETNYLETNKMMVGIGLGWSVLPRTMLEKDLICLKIRGLKLHRRLGVLQHRLHTLSNAARVLVDMLLRE